MARKDEGGRHKKGRGTKAERKTARRKVAQAGQGPVTPARTDKAGKDAWKRRLGPRRLGKSVIDAPGKGPITRGGAQPRRSAKAAPPRRAGH